ncbi:RNA polymerase sigma-70 factor (ECF subfamily) [Psychromicrobium silvestre]|uniref:RNA polymerase sigma-70 factor (ECF subfamily) n=1 Tax=Psychromicrobium silvestre TaxID=1645614 RepID=A0A7Y9LQW4_9MICC|nr:sigma-70 family RNA polymerase sigma factor [Psychromicrobium silvestre]NYE93926.1 RNA polymerase sigma-70 factor (ECF subfamily) [Psychromicrobium silvestre]
MNQNLLAGQFEQARPRLRALAYRMLGSLSEADDAVQEAWLRLSRTSGSEQAEQIDNLDGWLTTVLGRICLDFLRSRSSRREQPWEAGEEPEGYSGVHVPDPILEFEEKSNPEHQALLADSVGLALLVVLETLPPAERLAFVLHDVFALPFEEIADIVDKTPAAARQLASRARRKVQSTANTPDPDLSRQQQVVKAFQAASRSGDLEALVSVLDPDIVLRVDYGPRNKQSKRVRGAAQVAAQALTFSKFAPFARPALVNGAAGMATVVEGKLFSVTGFTVADGKVQAIDILADPLRLSQLELPQRE